MNLVPLLQQTIGMAWGSSLLLLLAASTPAKSAPAASLPELWWALGVCAQVTGVPAGASGSEVIVMFSLKRDGSLLGLPRITYSHLFGDADTQRAFVAAALTMVAGCLPVEITDGLGGAVAGRPLRLRLFSPPKGRST